MSETTNTRRVNSDDQERKLRLKAWMEVAQWVSAGRVDGYRPAMQIREEGERRYGDRPSRERRVLRLGEKRWVRVRINVAPDEQYPFELSSDAGLTWSPLFFERDEATPGTALGQLLLNPDNVVLRSGGAV